MGIAAAFIISLIISIWFSPYKRSGSLMPLVVLFFVLFFAGIAAQFWVVPFGPVLWGVAWLRILLVVLIFALLFSAPPIHRPKLQPDTEAETDPVVTAIGAFIWIILLLLAIAVIVGFYYSDPELTNKVLSSQTVM